jgi:hypothetical protein
MHNHKLNLCTLNFRKMQEVQLTRKSESIQLSVTEKGALSYSLPVDQLLIANCIQEGTTSGKVAQSV